MDMELICSCTTIAWPQNKRMQDESMRKCVCGSQTRRIECLKIRLGEAKPSRVGFEAGKRCQLPHLSPRAIGSLRARGIDRGEINKQRPIRSGARSGALEDRKMMREGRYCAKSNCGLMLF